MANPLAALAQRHARAMAATRAQLIIIQALAAGWSEGARKLVGDAEAVRKSTRIGVGPWRSARTRPPPRGGLRGARAAIRGAHAFPRVQWTPITPFFTPFGQRRGVTRGLLSETRTPRIPAVSSRIGYPGNPLAKVDVEGSNPFSRSINSHRLAPDRTPITPFFTPFGSRASHLR
jgi:hypothetical protein